MHLFAVLRPLLLEYWLEFGGRITDFRPRQPACLMEHVPIEDQPTVDLNLRYLAMLKANRRRRATAIDFLHGWHLP